MKTPSISQDAQDFLETLLWTLDTGEPESRHVKNWTIWEFHPEFTDAVESFCSGFRDYLEEHGPKDEDGEPVSPDDCDRSFGGNCFFSLSGHGVGFQDTREHGDAFREALIAYARGDRHAFEQINNHLRFSKFSGKIHLSFRTAAFRREQLTKIFGHLDPSDT
jgi:hypothetical protein